MAQRGSGTVTKRGKIWWVQVCVHGERIRQSSESEKWEVADRLRNRLLGQKARGELRGPNARITIDRVLDHYLADQALHVKPETLKIEKLVVEAHVRPHFGRLRVEKITSAALAEYRAMRTKEGASPTTCNRELGYLRTAMRTAAATTPPMLQLSSIPRFPIVNEDGFARQGFIEDGDIEKVVVTLPSYLVPLVTVAYNVGIRRGELMRIDWDQVDFSGGVIRLYRGRTKTGEPRVVPMLGTMETVLLEAKAYRDEFYPDCNRVFSRLGEPIKSFKNAWERAVTRAGFPDLQFHDLRRSGARNLSRAGVPDRMIMAITGHKTRSMLDRYNIVSESDITDVAAKVKAHRATREQQKQGEGLKSTATISATVPKKEGSK
jgi:integrase